LTTLFNPLLNPAHPSFGLRVLNNDSNKAVPYYFGSNEKLLENKEKKRQENR
jgi:hypothetical protein